MAPFLNINQQRRLMLAYMHSLLHTVFVKRAKLMHRLARHPEISIFQAQIEQHFSVGKPPRSPLLKRSGVMQLILLMVSMWELQLHLSDICASSGRIHWLLTFKAYSIKHVTPLPALLTHKGCKASIDIYQLTSTCKCLLVELPM